MAKPRRVFGPAVSRVAASLLQENRFEESCVLLTVTGERHSALVKPAKVVS